MGASFESAKELREAIDQVFSMMDADPDMGPKLRDADTPQRFEFSDFDVVVNIRAARGREVPRHREPREEDDDPEPLTRHDGREVLHPVAGDRGQDEFRRLAVARQEEDDLTRGRRVRIGAGAARGDGRGVLDDGS